jgi:hypothetical protein
MKIAITSMRRTDTLSATAQFCAPTDDCGRFVRDSALLGLGACAGHSKAGIDTRTMAALAQIATVQSYGRIFLFSGVISKRSPQRSVTGAVPPRTCEGPLMAQSGSSNTNGALDKVLA